MSVTGGTTTFDRATAVHRLAEGRYRARMDRAFWVVRGPNGGYVAAVILRALSDHLAEPHRSPRSLTVHYPRAPREGEVTIETRIERRGRSLATGSARMTQDGEVVALALAAFSPAWNSQHDFVHRSMPTAPPPDATAPLPPFPTDIPIREQFELRPVFGEPPFSRAERAVVGGWIRCAEPRPLDPPLLATLSDAWYPATFPVLSRPAALPTVDLTIHFRAHPVPASAEGWVLARFESTVARDGFVEEDGELWTPDGTLVAQSRQLALLI